MEIHLRMHSLIPVALLFLCCISGCLALTEKWSDYDEVMKRNGHHSFSVIRELPKKGQASLQAYTVSTNDNYNKEEWAPLRIVTSTLDLEDETRYCKNERDMRPTYDGKESVCADYNILTTENKKLITDVILPEAIKLHSERLFVKPLTEPLKVPESIKNNTPCQYFTVPDEHYTNGINNADMVLYVATGPLQESGRGSYCAQGKDNRPIVGSLALRPNVRYGTLFWTRLVAHEIAHALGFDYDLMKKLNMISNITNVRGKPHAIVVSSMKTKEKAREHYNCDRIEGMELQESEGQVVSQWSRRNAKDELMSENVGTGLYTSLTMAAFEDMKFYKANWGMEEPMKWGNNSGCDLFEKKCMENGKSNYPEMFCEENDIYFHCTSDRLYMGNCHTRSYDSELPEYYQYFSTPRYGGSGGEATEYCPIITAIGEVPCRRLQKNYPGVLTGENSWCLDGESLTLNHSAQKRTWQAGGVCAEVLCNKGKVQVKYDGSDRFFDCPEGESITPTSPYFISGKIKCPKYSEVCTIASNGSSLVITGSKNDATDASPSQGEETSTPNTGSATSSQGSMKNDGTKNNQGNTRNETTNMQGKDNSIFSFGFMFPVLVTLFIAISITF